jgi:alpha-ketoglutarate-dependent taurine dioxygenase
MRKIHGMSRGKAHEARKWERIGMASAVEARRSPTQAEASGTGQSVAIRPLDAPFGAEVTGIDWERGSDGIVDVLTRAMRHHLLLVFRGQRSPEHEEVTRFFAPFGRLVRDSFDGQFHYNTFNEKDQVQRPGGVSGVNYVVNTDQGQTELDWHSDHFHRPQIKIISVLEALEIGEGSVPTQFRDMYTAYEMLPAAIKGELEHKMTVNLDPRKMDLEKYPRLADSMHPVFQAHPHSWRRTLYVNAMTFRIAGFPIEESDHWLAVLRAHAAEHAPRLDHYWTPGEICVWDNVGLRHRRDPMPGGITRRLRQFEGVAE